MSKIIGSQKAKQNETKDDHSNMCDPYKIINELFYILFFIRNRAHFHSDTKFHWEREARLEMSQH